VAFPPKKGAPSPGKFPPARGKPKEDTSSPYKAAKALAKKGGAFGKSGKPKGM